MQTAFTGAAYRPGDDVDVITGFNGADCGFPFRQGEDYLIYAYRDQKGRLATSICSRTRHVTEAKQDLDYFRSLATMPPGAELRILTYDALARDWPPQGLAGVRVSIRGGPSNRESRVAATDGAGELTQAKLPPGQYAVTAAARAGYVAELPQAPVELVDKGCAVVRLPLRLDRRVVGRVVTREGVPAPGVEVQAVPRRPRMENELPFPADEATTDAEGKYQLDKLPGGDYYLGINLARTPPEANPYTRWFVPGTASPSAAAIVHLPERPGVYTFDITLPPKQNVRLVRGVVVRPDGKPVPGIQLSLEDPRWPWQAFSVVTATTDARGRFELKCLDGTAYRLHTTGPESGEPAVIKPGAGPLELRLAVTRHGPPAPIAGEYRGVERWRKGLGLE